jgi:hypothetical protein
MRSQITLCKVSLVVDRSTIRKTECERQLPTMALFLPCKTFARRAIVFKNLTYISSKTALYSLSSMSMLPASICFWKFSHVRASRLQIVSISLWFRVIFMVKGFLLLYCTRLIKGFRSNQILHGLIACITVVWSCPILQQLLRLSCRPRS